MLTVYKRNHIDQETIVVNSVCLIVCDCQEVLGNITHICYGRAEISCRTWQPYTGNVSFYIRVRSSPHAAESMAAKNKHRKKSKATKKVTFESEDKEPAAGNNSGEADGGKEKKEKAEEEELDLEEVLRLGGTQVSSPTC